MSLRVLVVDDDPGICEFVSDCLAEAGYHVRCAGSIPAAREAGAEFAPDVALVDMVLPGRGSGTQLASELAANGAGVVLMSGYPDAMDGQERLLFPFIAKPFRLRTLLQAVLRASAQPPAPPFLPLAPSPTPS
jgi:DNA-binding NtrC family response regulator